MISPHALGGRCARHHAIGMFVITDAAVIPAVFDGEGALSAVIELRPGMDR